MNGDDAHYQGGKLAHALKEVAIYNIAIVGDDSEGNDYYEKHLYIRNASKQIDRAAFFIILNENSIFRSFTESESMKQYDKSTQKI